MVLTFTQTVLAIASGSVVGFSLGLVGGGGSILAVPLLVYVVGLDNPHIAIGTSAIAVAPTAVFKLTISASRAPELCAARRHQWSVNPFGGHDSEATVLNDRTATTNSGMYKNASTNHVKLPNNSRTDLVKCIRGSPVHPYGGSRGCTPP